MAAHSATIVVEFCRLCNWAYEAWITHRYLFEENPCAGEFQKSAVSEGLSRLSIITQEYVLQQIAKLHDPATQNRQINLTVEYIVNFGGWDDSTKTTLLGLQQRLSELSEKIRPARHKIFSHNDRATILAGAPLGYFEQGADVEYFNVLQEFADIVHGQVVGGPYPFNDLAKNDAFAIIDALAK